MRNLTKLNTSLIGIALISIFAFLGFGVIFQKYEISIATQALTAAFGALFVLLSTKFLMEQEGENRVTGEKRSVVFKENVSDYKRAVQVLIKIMDKKEISTNDIQIMLRSHALLILLGDVAAIKGYSKFIEKCQTILEGSDLSGGQDLDITSNDLNAEITTDDEAALWSLMIEFLAAARRGLDLNNDTLTVEDEKNIFRKITTKQANIEASIQARRSLGGIADWLRLKDIDSSLLRTAEKFVEIMNEVGLTHKVTATQISLFDPNHSNERRVLYIERYNKRHANFIMTFNSTSDENLMQNLRDRLFARDAKVRTPRDGQYDVMFGVAVSSIEQNDITDIKDAVKYYILNVHQDKNDK